MTNSKNTFTFNGFEPANTTPVPDVLFDVLLPYLNEAQLKVMLYIIRRTLGFKKTSDAISLNQFRRGITTKDGKKLDDGCGLKNFTTISKALKELEQMNCIESDKRETDEGNNLTTVYRIRFRGTTPNVVGTTDNVVGVLRQTYDRTTSSGGRVLRQTEPQETVRQQTDSQETVRQERERITVAPPDVGALALPSKTEAFIEKLREWRIEDEQPEEDITQAETVKVPVVSKQNTPTPTPAQAPSPQAEQAALGQTAQQNHSAVTPCSAVVTPDGGTSGVTPTKGKAKKQAEPKVDAPKSPPAEPPSEMPWGTRKCLLWFDYWRGGTLIGTYKNSQASTCAKGLSQQFSEEVVIQTRNTMADDPYWIARGGPDVCEVANNIHRYVRKQHLQLVATPPASKPMPRIATKEELRRIPV